MKRLFCLKTKNGLGRFALSTLPHDKQTLLSGTAYISYVHYILVGSLCAWRFLDEALAIQKIELRDNTATPTKRQFSIALVFPPAASDLRFIVGLGFVAGASKPCTRS